MKVQPAREILLGELGCCWCGHVFQAPKEATTLYAPVVCPACKTEEDRSQYQVHELDPLQHPLGWPYNDPTVPYDC